MKKSRSIKRVRYRYKMQTSLQKHPFIVIPSVQFIESCNALSVQKSVIGVYDAHNHASRTSDTSEATAFFIGRISELGGT